MAIDYDVTDEDFPQYIEPNILSQYDGAISTYVGRSAVLRYDLTNMRRKQYFCTDKTVA